MKIKVGNIVYIVITLIFILISLNNSNVNPIFILNLILCILICIRSKFSFFSLRSILIIYVLIAVCYQYNTGKSYGLLEYTTHSQLEFFMMNILCFIYNSILYITITNTNVLNKENEIIKNNIEISNTMIVLCSIVGIASAIIAFPNLNFSENTERFKSLLPGNAWNHVCIITLLFMLPKFKDSKIVKFSYLFCIVWFLLHYERVDMIGLLIAVIFYLAKTSENLKIRIGSTIKQYKNVVIYVILICIVIIVMVIIGEARAGNRSNTLANISKKILIQNTAADVGYVYNSTIIEVKNNGFKYGETYITYIEKIIPFVSSKHNASVYLRDKYHTAGGILIICEPYMNFGISGVIVFSIIEMLIFCKIVKSKKRIMYYMYLIIISTVFRTTWYGLEYIEKAVIYILPFLYIVFETIEKKERKYYEK